MREAGMSEPEKIDTIIQEIETAIAEMEEDKNEFGDLLYQCMMNHAKHMRVVALALKRGLRPE
jgi:hypothetical protein